MADKHATLSEAAPRAMLDQWTYLRFTLFLAAAIYKGICLLLIDSPCALTAAAHQGRNSCTDLPILAYVEILQ